MLSGTTSDNFTLVSHANLFAALDSVGELSFL
jgi:hypothetical protein